MITSARQDWALSLFFTSAAIGLAVQLFLSSSALSVTDALMPALLSAGLRAVMGMNVMMARGILVFWSLFSFMANYPEIRTLSFEGFVFLGALLFYSGLAFYVIRCPQNSGTQ